mgnify:CR=1 FL=1
MESQIQITKGNSKTLTPEKVPADATSKVNYVWKVQILPLYLWTQWCNYQLKKEGTATVTASVKGRSSIKASVKVKVITKADSLSRSVSDVLAETKAYVLATDKTPLLEANGM